MAFAVIRDAITAKELVGMGGVVLASRERPIIIRPMGPGLLGISEKCPMSHPPRPFFESDEGKIGSRFL
jgi:hypothetical protein